MSPNNQSGAAATNTTPGSIARVQHSEPTVTLLARVAAGPVGNVGMLGAGRKKDLHFTLIIEDAYTGIFGFDGQPGLDPAKKPSMTSAAIDSMLPIAGIRSLVKNVKIITKYYRNILPADVLLNIQVAPPQGMAASVFASRLIAKACGFANYRIDYSAPSGIIGATMVKGEYNSSSYIAGLLNSVLGYVPVIDVRGYQAPGWEAPIPAEYFRDESCR